MTTLTVTAKGQITLRKDVLRHLGVAPGQKIEIDMLPNGRLEMRAANSASDAIRHEDRGARRAGCHRAARTHRAGVPQRCRAASSIREQAWR